MKNITIFCEADTIIIQLILYNIVIIDSHKKQTKTTFYSASARRSLHETSSALSVQKGDASSDAFSVKSVCFLLKNSIKLLFWGGFLNGERHISFSACRKAGLL